MVVVDAAAAVTLPLRRRVARVAPWFGPAFVAAIAYADPGNFATNFTGGATFGYLLVWVIVAANLMAMLIQSLSAKLGRGVLAAVRLALSSVGVSGTPLASSAAPRSMGFHRLRAAVRS